MLDPIVVAVTATAVIVFLPVDPGWSERLYVPYVQVPGNFGRYQCW
jgi:hypothetical protein